MKHLYADFLSEQSMGLAWGFRGWFQHVCSDTTTILILLMSTFETLIVTRYGEVQAAR